MNKLIGFVFLSLALVACSKTNNTRPELDVRTRVFSPGGDSFVECKGNGCPDEIMQMVAEMKTPTKDELDQFRVEYIYKLEHPRPLRSAPHDPVGELEDQERRPFPQPPGLHVHR